METLESRLTPAGNILVLPQTNPGVPSSLVTYSPSGTELSSLPVTPAPASNYGPGDTRGIAIDPSGKIYVYNGSFHPALSIYDTSTKTWTNRTFPNWNSFGRGGNGGIAVFENYVYVTDETIGSDPPGSDGIVRFNLADGSAARYSVGTDYNQLTVGLDGLLYGLHGAPFHVDVFDPVTMRLLRTINLPFGSDNIDYDLLGIAVNGDGDIFAADYSGRVIHFAPDGATVATETLPLAPGSRPFTPSALNINIATDGTLVVGTRSNFVCELFSDFTNASYIAAGSSDLQTAAYFADYQAPRDRRHRRRKRYQARLLWDNADGRTRWNVNNTFQVSSATDAGPYTGWTGRRMFRAATA